MIAKKLRDLKKGEYFTRKPIEEPKDSQVLIKGDYDRAGKKYSCLHFDDVNYEVFIKASATVYTDFIF